MGKALRRAGTLLLFLLVGLCFAPALVPAFLDRIYYDGPASGHHDGRRFFNPEDRSRPPVRVSPARFFNRWASGDGRAKWPDQIPVRPTVPPRRVEGERMLVTWIGHSTVLVQTEGVNILTDPIWSERASPFSFVGPKRVRAPGVRLEDLPKIDLILVSHNHYDHMDLPTLKRLWDRDRPLIVTSLGNDAILRRAHIGLVPEAETPGPPVPTGVAGFDWGDRIAMQPPCREPRRSCPAPLDVTVERVHHWGSRWGTDRNRALWSGFTVRLPGGNLFFAGDTGWGGGEWVREAARHGPYRFAIIPVGAYLPREVMQSNHVDPDEAAAIFQGIGAARALGVHWGTFQLTFEGIDDPPRRLSAALKARGIDPSRFVTTEVGATFSVPPLAPPAGR
jgi:L-ascorbate metabolism protein UlaG (beta-lactamase superfamily)